MSRQQTTNMVSTIFDKKNMVSVSTLRMAVDSILSLDHKFIESSYVKSYSILREALETNYLCRVRFELFGFPSPED